MHGLGGVSFVGAPGATAHWRVRSAAGHDRDRVSDASPTAAHSPSMPMTTSSARCETAGEAKTPGYASFKIPPGAHEIHGARHQGHGAAVRRGIPPAERRA